MRLFNIWIVRVNFVLEFSFGQFRAKNKSVRLYNEGQSSLVGWVFYGSVCDSFIWRCSFFIGVIMRNLFLSGSASVIFGCCAAHAQSAQVTYTYDDLGRVIEVQYAGGSRLEYDYDAADNRNAVTLYDPSGQVVTTPPPTPPRRTFG